MMISVAAASTTARAPGALRGRSTMTAAAVFFSSSRSRDTAEVL